MAYKSKNISKSGSSSASSHTKNHPLSIDFVVFSTISKYIRYRERTCHIAAEWISAESYSGVRRKDSFRQLERHGIEEHATLSLPGHQMIHQHLHMEKEQREGLLSQGRESLAVWGTTRMNFIRICLPIKSFDASGYVQKKWVKRQDKVMLYLQVAGKKALEAAGVSWEEDDTLDKTKCGILIGTAMGGLMTFSTAAEALAKSGHRKMNPFCIPFAISNMGGAMLAIDLGFMGPNYSISTACATGNYCIMQAAEHIRRGEANLMLAGGADAAVIPSGIGGFIACKALSKRNDDPAAASRPWDKNRDGFVMGEGAGVLALEELEHAKARGAPILAEFIGGAFTCDAHHISDPDPEGKGVISCIKKSLENARINPTDVDYVNAHGTSTPAGDMAEYRAISSVLGHENVRINSTKSMIGHLLGGAGAVEAVAVVEAIRRDRLHPNLNLDDPEDGVNLNILVGREQQAHTVNVALSNSFGFGGHNSSILFKKFEE
ncbi:hypothetical protein M9435_000093 [Picochlorum sp. BPE23]|nr:hypothetical protein M9435_000093 [Picochlorum sp. BPE23]